MDGIGARLRALGTGAVAPLFEFLRRIISHGGPGRSYIYLPPGSEEEAARLFRPPGPLVGLIASGQTRSGHEADLTLLLVEERTHEFRVHILLSVPAGNASRSGWFPQMILDASDDQGRHYRAGRSGGNSYHGEWWMIGRLEPALAPDASRLDIQVSEILWYGVRPPQNIEVQAGPWTFSISLRPAGAEGSGSGP